MPYGESFSRELRNFTHDLDVIGMTAKPINPLVFALGGKVLGNLVGMTGRDARCFDDHVLPPVTWIWMSCKEADILARAAAIAGLSEGS
ncbi:hypothetical protein [Ruegeria arenilitoris]|uniref:hypothetical protein n=1 Tax=Ruegeria arenilitoris TaxID=1173585 RepID=UPI00147B0621|nr:hypothetical protein [Ruegeria arenilitoris]